ncbi:MAG: transglycosylase SLT domain-containing protein [Candidatus Riflebacteria bacterium]|nr:transglycosylase SLT domain-containing protein [Candidatus Riflebacteria bacterium]
MNNLLYKRVLKLGMISGFVVFSSITGFAQTFEQNLAKIGTLYDSKKYQELYNVVQPTKANDNLKDVRLYMEAEALKNTNRKPEALKVYSDLINKYPDSESALLARMTHFMLLLENANPNDLPKLESVASSLKTVWQKGTAFYKLSDLPFIDISTRSRFAFRSLKEFNADRFFYQTAAGSVELLKKILSNPTLYKFSRQEWLSIAVWTINENLTAEVFKTKANQIALEAGFGKTVTDILNAEYLNKQKKSAKSMEAFAAIINNKKNSPEMIAWAHQLRGNIKHFEGKHSEAVTDYLAASNCKDFPVDPVAVKYRLMRSSFSCGRDAETIEYIKQFIKADFKGGVLPVHIYEMGLKLYDEKQFQRALPYFMIVAKNFPGHYRADDSLAYSAFCAGLKTKDGQALVELLKKKYPNSFFIWWISPQSRNDSLKLTNKPVEKLSEPTKTRLDAIDKLWGTKLNFLAKSEALKLTDKYKSNMALYKAVIELAKKHKDYQQLVSFGERLARQISEADKPLSTMPKWGWEALYPMVYDSEVKKYSAKFGVDKFWILSIMREESHFKEDILSRSNAMGLMQILPSTGKWIAGKLGEKNFKKDMLWKPEVNIRYGTWYLNYLQELFKGDKFLASASYNGGQGNIQRKVEAGPYAKLPVLDRLDKVPLPETRDYYKKVMGSHWNYKRLY